MVEHILENTWSSIINNKYEAYYQPQFNNFTGEIVGLEALARLVDANGLILPTHFITTLEKNGLIGKLDLFIFDSVCKFINKCKDNNAKVVPVSINLSCFDFDDSDFVDELEEIRTKHHIDAELIKIEITDALANNDEERAIQIIKKLHQCGYTIELDNFRGGDPKLRFLKTILYDAIKLDINFLNSDLLANNGKLVSQIFDRAKSLNIPIIAEHVETKEQMEFLKSMSCEISQGYYFAKPKEEKFIFDILRETEFDIEKKRMQQKLSEAEGYKRKFENLLNQVDIYYWEYMVSTKEMYPGLRSRKHFNFDEIVPSFPQSIIGTDFIALDYVETFCDLFKQIDNGAKHVEAIVKMTKDNIPYIVRCESEFNELGKPQRAYCSATRVIQ